MIVVLTTFIKSYNCRPRHELRASVGGRSIRACFIGSRLSSVASPLSGQEDHFREAAYLRTPCAPTCRSSPYPVVAPGPGVAAEGPLFVRDKAPLPSMPLAPAIG